MLTVLALGVIGALVAGFASAIRQPSRVSRTEAVRRVLWHIERKPIGALAEGEAAVVRGTAVAIDDPLVAPLSGQSCIGYHLVIRSHPLGEIAVDHARCGAFAVADATGEARVSPDGLELVVSHAPSHLVWPPLPADLLAWVPPRWRGGAIVVSEGVLIEGQQVAVCGVMQAAIAAGELYREGHTRRELTASPTFPLVASPDEDLEAQSHRPIRPEELRDAHVR